MKIKITKDLITKMILIILNILLLLVGYLLYSEINYKHNSQATIGTVIKVNSENSFFVEYNSKGILKVVEITSYTEDVDVNDNYTIYYQKDNSNNVKNNLNTAAVGIYIGIITFIIGLDVYCYIKKRKEVVK